MSKTILGVDPGSSGALSFYNIEELIIFDMPVFEIKKGKTIRKRVDFRELCRIIQEQKPDHAMVEQVSAQFGNGAAAAFSFGRACEAVENALIACNVPYSFVTPQAWKKSLQCPAEKDGARLRASQLLPQFSHNWPLKKHSDRAESSLLALYAFRKDGSIT